VFYYYAISQIIFGGNTWGVRVMDIVLLVFSCWLIMRAVKRVYGQAAGVGSALLTYFWYASSPAGSIAQNDSLIALLLILAVVPLLSAESGTSRKVEIAAVGALIGVSALSKPFYAGFLLLPMVALLDPDLRARTGSAKVLALLLISFLLPVGFVLAVYASSGNVSNFYTTYIVYNLTVYTSASSSMSDGLSAATGVLASMPLVWGIPFAGIGLWVAWRHDRRHALLLGYWTLFSLGCVLVQQRYYWHHWIPLFPPLAILTAIGLFGWWGRTSRVSAARGSRAVAMVAFGIILIVAIERPAVQVLRYGLYKTGHISEADYSNWFGSPFVSVPEEHEVAEFVAGNSTSSDRMYVLGFTGTINYLADRMPPTRWVYAPPITGDGNPELLEAYRKEFLSGMLERPPMFLVTVAGPNYVQLLGELPELGAMIRGQYAKVGETGKFTIHRLRSQQTLGD
jgi:hypothetical protein